MLFTKRIICALLALCITVAVFELPAIAFSSAGEELSEDTAQPRFTYISSTGTTVTLTDGEVAVFGSVTCYPTATSCKAVVYLQRREIGTTTWYNKAIFTGYGTTDCAAGGTRSAAVGYEYRAKAVYTVNNGAEETTSYSRIAQYTSSTP